MILFYYGTTGFYSKPNPSFHLMHAMISDLLERGDEVYFVGPGNALLERNIPEEFEKSPYFHYNLVLRKPGNKKQFVKRYFRGIQYSLLSRKYVKQYLPSCDAVFLQSSPTMVFNTIIARKYATKQKLYLNVQDMFPGSSIASGVMTKKFMQNIFYRLQKVAYWKSDIIVGISEDMRIKLMEQGVPREKTAVILNWFDDNTVHEVKWEDNRFVKKYSMSKDIFYVQYAGTMGNVFDYKMVLDVADRLMSFKDIEIQMIGMGSQKATFMEEANKKKLTNIKFLPLEPQEMVSDVYSACSVCFIPLKHGIIGNSVPSKAGLLMACKRAIITSADEGCEYAKELNENGVGIACADNKPEDVVNAILRLYNNRSLCAEIGLKGYDYGFTLYSRTENMKKYIDLFES